MQMDWGLPTIMTSLPNEGGPVYNQQNRRSVKSVVEWVGGPPPEGLPQLAIYNQ